MQRRKDCKSLTFILKSKMTLNQIMQNGCLRYKPIMGLLIPTSKPEDKSSNKRLVRPATASNHYKRPQKRKVKKLEAIGKPLLNSRKTLPRPIPDEVKKQRKNISLLRCKSSNFRTRNFLRSGSSKHSELGGMPLISCLTYSTNASLPQKPRRDIVINARKKPSLTKQGKENCATLGTSFMVEGRVISPVASNFLTSFCGRNSELTLGACQSMKVNRKRKGKCAKRGSPLKPWSRGSSPVSSVNGADFSCLS